MCLVLIPFAIKLKLGSCFLYSSKFWQQKYPLFFSLILAACLSQSVQYFSFQFSPVFLVGQYPVENGGWVETEINGTPLIKCIEMRYHEAAKWFTLLADFLAWRNPFQLLCGEIPSPHTCVIRWNSPMRDARGNNEGFNKFSQNPFRSDNYWNVGDCLQGPLEFVKLFLSLRKECLCSRKNSVQDC